MRTLRRVLIFSSELGWDGAAFALEDAGVVAEAAAAALALGVPGAWLVVEAADWGSLWFRRGFSFSTDEPVVEDEE